MQGGLGKKIISMANQVAQSRKMRKFVENNHPIWYNNHKAKALKEHSIGKAVG